MSEKPLRECDIIYLFIYYIFIAFVIEMRKKCLQKKQAVSEVAIYAEGTPYFAQG
jgi:hypothetical protein